ncbi:MAG: (4Fe-4S)-binding protein [Trueperaceae bacterium]|nr:(4Fe-4S)-binding protein [Trueperaceae bacterium]
MTESQADTSGRTEEEQGESRGRAYRSEGITVYFDARKCIHSGVCVRGLPEVFDVKRRPWVRADLAAPDAVAAQIDRCPSGALSYDLRGDAGNPAAG